MTKKNQKKSKNKRNTKTKGDGSKVSYDVNDILLCKTFAGPEVSMRVLSKVDRPSGFKSDKEKGLRVRGFWGCLINKSDQLSLINKCVPLDKKENPKDCKSFVFEWHIIKGIKKNKNKKRS